MKNLENREDIILLVNSFYQKVEKSDIGFFFNDIAKVNWEEHLPKMYDFWCTLIFGDRAYKGNPMAVHFPINAIQAMEKKHFETWLHLWISTVEENFYGENAEVIIQKANNIASLMSYKMELARRM